MGKPVLPYLYGRQKNKVKAKDLKILILTYYWPPSGGSGVQRWMYFAKYLKQLGHDPIVITVDETQASYPVLDTSLTKEVEGIRVVKTSTREPLRWYSRLISGDTQKGIPQGAVQTKSIFGKLTAYIRGNFFIPDARKGWVPFAIKAAEEVIVKNQITHLITTGPPHSTHLAGLELKEAFKLKWWVDFRDPWTDIFYNTALYRTQKTVAKDQALERKVLQKADGIMTTVAGILQDQLKIKTSNKPFVSIPNGYDADLMEQTEAAPKKKGFHIVYTGLLTQNQEYKKLLTAIHQVSNHSTIYFSLAGNISPTIISEIKSNLPKVKVDYIGYLPHNKAIALMKSADLLLNFIFKGAENQMLSGKLIEYMATGVPVLSLGNPNSEAGRLLDLGTASKMIEKDDTSKILVFLEKAEKQKGEWINSFPQKSNLSRKGTTQNLIEALFT